MMPVKRTPLCRPPRYNTLRVVFTALATLWLILLAAAAIMQMIFWP